MKTKRLFILMVMTVLVACSAWAKDDEVIITRQLTTGQRNALPEKTITVEMKRLSPNKRADVALLNAIEQVMDTIAQEDYQNRCFVMKLSHLPGDDISIEVHSDDIVTRGRQNEDAYYGDLEHKRYHFAVIADRDDMSLLTQTFKRQGKLKFVQEFEFVDFKTPVYPTTVCARWNRDGGLQWLTVIINDDGELSPKVHPIEIEN